jgi:hypothetical protein
MGLSLPSLDQQKMMKKTNRSKINIEREQRHKNLRRDKARERELGHGEPVVWPDRRVAGGSSSGEDTSGTQKQWWVKEPTMAGEGMTSAQQRLSRPSNFTGYYKRTYQSEGDPSNWKASGIGDCAVGDFCADPKAARKMFVNSRIPGGGRALDFRCETDWRLALRPDNAVPQGQGSSLSASASLPQLQQIQQDQALANVLRELEAEKSQETYVDPSGPRPFTGTARPIRHHDQFATMPKISTNRWQRENNPNHARYAPPPPGDPGSKEHKRLGGLQGAVSTSSLLPGVGMYFQE